MVEIYKIIFKAESPIHIGYRQIGNLKTTRYYIMGKQMWGAITSNLTKALFENPKSDEYKKVGEFVKEHIKATYFYPAIKKDDKTQNLGKNVDGYVVLLPKYTETENGLKIDELSKEKFEQYFIKSYVSTALEINTRTAEECSLHEFEYINSKICYKEKIYDVYWIGYLIVDENREKDGIKIEECNGDDIRILSENNNDVSLKDVLNIIQVGGERNYGFGKLKLEKIKKTDKLFNTYQIEIIESEEDSKTIYLIKPTNDSLIAHLELEPNNNKIKGFHGEIEAFSGMEWENNENKKKKGAGQKIGEIKICLTPGSTIEMKDEAKISLGYFGILKIQS